MKTLLATAILLSASGGNALAPYLNLTPNGDYQGSSGAQYQYDLSRPSDQLHYEVDPNRR